MAPTGGLGLPEDVLEELTLADGSALDLTPVIVSPDIVANRQVPPHKVTVPENHKHHN